MTSPKPSQPSQPAPTPLFIRLLEAITYIGIYGGLLMPFFYNPNLVVFPFIFFKILAFQAVIGLTFPAWVALAFLDARYRPRKSWVLLAVTANYAAIALSVVFGFDPHRAWWGNQERMNGLFSLLHFFAWLLMTTSSLRTWDQWKRLFQWQALIGAGMAGIVLVQKVTPGFIGSNPNDRLSGTLGNPIYSGIYHSMVCFVYGLLFARTRSLLQRAFYALATVASVLAIFYASSRGPLMGFFVGATVAGLVWSIVTKHRKILVASLATAAVALTCWSIVAFVFMKLPAMQDFWKAHGAISHLFTVEADPARLSLWATAWKGFLARPITGWGMAGYDVVFDTYFPAWFLCRGMPETLQDAAHSVYFEQLANMGLLGILSLVAAWGLTLYTFLGPRGRRELDVALIGALAGATVTYVVQAFFVFDSPAPYLLTHLLWAAAASMSHPDFSPLPEPAPPPDAKGRSAPPPRTAPTRGAFVATPALAYALPLFLACEGAGAGVVYGASYQPGLASYQTKEAFTAFQYGSCKGTLSWAEKAIQTWTPYLDDQMYFLARAVGVMAESGRLDRCPEWPRLLEISRGIAQRLFRNHPTHVRQRGIYANFLFAMGRATHDQKLLDEARVNYEQLVTESPNRQQYRFDYSNFLAENGRVPEGEAQLQRAVQADPQVGEARWRLGIYQWGRMNQAQLGAEQMIKGATEGCPYPVHSLEVSQLTSAYMVRGDREGMKSLLKFLDGLAPDDRPTQVHLSVAASFERIGMIPERDKVLALAVSRDTSLAPRLQPLRDGRVRSLAELDQYYQQQKAAQQAKPPAAPPPTPWTPGAGAPKK